MKALNDSRVKLSETSSKKGMLMNKSHGFTSLIELKYSAFISSVIWLFSLFVINGTWESDLINKSGYPKENIWIKRKRVKW